MRRGLEALSRDRGHMCEDWRVARETVPSYCRFCFNACAMLVDLEDGRPVAVRGDKSNTIYQGYFCVKGQQLIAAQRHPERLLCSQKRGADGAFAPIPSAQAFDEIARQLVRIRERHGPRAIVIRCDTRRLNRSCSDRSWRLPPGPDRR